MGKDKAAQHLRQRARKAQQKAEEALDEAALEAALVEARVDAVLAAPSMTELASSDSASVSHPARFDESEGWSLDELGLPPFSFAENEIAQVKHVVSAGLVPELQVYEFQHERKENRAVKKAQRILRVGKDFCQLPLGQRNALMEQARIRSVVPTGLAHLRLCQQMMDKKQHIDIDAESKLNQMMNKLQAHTWQLIEDKGIGKVLNLSKNNQQRLNNYFATWDHLACELSDLPKRVAYLGHANKRGHVCYGCGRYPIMCSDPSKCSGCGLRFCNDVCQRRDWKEFRHKWSCAGSKCRQAAEKDLDELGLVGGYLDEYAPANSTVRARAEGESLVDQLVRRMSS